MNDFVALQRVHSFKQGGLTQAAHQVVSQAPTQATHVYHPLATLMPLSTQSMQEESCDSLRKVTLCKPLVTKPQPQQLIHHQQLQAYPICLPTQLGSHHQLALKQGAIPIQIQASANSCQQEVSFLKAHQLLSAKQLHMQSSMQHALH